MENTIDKEALYQAIRKYTSRYPEDGTTTPEEDAIFFQIINGDDAKLKALLQSKPYIDSLMRTDWVTIRAFAPARKNLYLAVCIAAKAGYAPILRTLHNLSQQHMTESFEETIIDFVVISAPIKGLSIPVWEVLVEIAPNCVHTPLSQGMGPLGQTLLQIYVTSSAEDRGRGFAIVKFLLENGVDPWAGFEWPAKEPENHLTGAIRFGSRDLVELLLTTVSGPRAATILSVSLLGCVAEDKMDVMQLLYEHGADIHATHDHLLVYENLPSGDHSYSYWERLSRPIYVLVNESPLELALRYQALKSMEWLLSHNFDTVVVERILKIATGSDDKAVLNIFESHFTRLN